MEGRHSSYSYIHLADTIQGSSSTSMVAILRVSYEATEILSSPAPTTAMYGHEAAILECANQPFS